MIMRDKFNKDLFVQPIGNRGDNKPNAGGVWTSSLIGKHSSQWEQFTSAEGFYEDTSIVKHIVKPNDDVKVLVIDSKEDYKLALDSYGINVDMNEHSMTFGAEKVLNYEQVMVDYDCIRLTEDGLYDNNPFFYTWDCESTLWFNVDKFDIVDIR